MQQTARDTFRKFIFAVLSTIIGGLIVYAYQDDFRAFIGKQDNTENELKQDTMEKELREAKADKHIEAERRKETPVDYTATPAGQFPKEGKGLGAGPTTSPKWQTPQIFLSTLTNPVRMRLDPLAMYAKVGDSLTGAGHLKMVLVEDSTRTWECPCGLDVVAAKSREEAFAKLPAGEYWLYPAKGNTVTAISLWHRKDVP